MHMYKFTIYFICYTNYGIDNLESQNANSDAERKDKKTNAIGYILAGLVRKCKSKCKKLSDGKRKLIKRIVQTTNAICP